MWELSEVPDRFEPVRLLADHHGYLAAIFGSVVRCGRGQDLDILMVRRFGKKANYQNFLVDFGGEIVRAHSGENCRNHSYEVVRGDRIYHFVFGQF